MQTWRSQLPRAGQSFRVQPPAFFSLALGSGTSGSKLGGNPNEIGIYGVMIVKSFD